ncbi:hypothetical protein E1264_10670 [Actinomadura sp. KC216]|uniref:DUF5988 family protein n=1 Tax=Actinomadura sp. KC216 TaxID=2530370 RepID=UPI00104E5E56|nr:DUF5988 family protein [Actinomadura sp. KC216]TDB88677.1 hypothetical protein E1264_10670 [Actinomadura sp. KC216]
MPDTTAVWLKGGPESLNGRRTTRPGTDKITIPRCGGYEHFEPTGRHEDGLPVYQWSYRTRIAG